MPQETLKPKDNQDIGADQLEPLSEEKQKELDGYFEKFKNTEISKERLEILRQLIQNIGERAVPFILNSDAFDDTKFLIRLLLNSLVTAKSAPLVLQAIQEKKISISQGALAAAEGKEKTLPGLVDLLLNLKFASRDDHDRSAHCALIDAISLIGRDEASENLANFYFKLRSDKDYREFVAKYLYETGIDLYQHDAFDIVRALARIDGPISRSLLASLSCHSDKPIKSAAENALNGSMYIGHVEKSVINSPNPNYYSDVLNSPPPLMHEIEESTNDRDEDESRADDFPEQLVTSSDLNTELLDPESDYSEEIEETLTRFLIRGGSAIETVNQLVKAAKTSHHPKKEVPERKQPEIIKAATILELFKLALKLPDLEAVGKELEEIFARTDQRFSKIEDKFTERPFDEDYKRRVAKTKKQTKDILKSFKFRLRDFTIEDFRLPESAQSFKLYHRRTERERQIKSFSELLGQVLKFELALAFFEIIQAHEYDDITPEYIIGLFNDLFSLYRDVSKRDVPIYRNGASRLEEISHGRQQIFYGRDADYFYYAVKAERFGLIGNQKPRKVYINRELAHGLRGSGDRLEMRNRILAYLLQEKVTADALHIDTGFSGSVPEAVLRALNPKLSDPEINGRIKLLKSSRADREDIGSHQDTAVNKIESRPKRYGHIQDVIRDEKTGRLKVKYDKPDHMDELRAWVVEQAVIRYFIPRKPGTKQ